MFKLPAKNEESRYWYPVTVHMVDDEGKKRRFDFDAQFVRLPQSEMEELLTRAKDAFENKEPIKDREVLDRVFVGWRKVQDVDGSELAVNDENRERLLEAHPVQPSVVRAWMKSCGIGGLEKN